ncbi:MAG: N-acetylmuramoyl-L-alanine amidase, partial [Planctomycetales bacterium]|nr:N-acetylmuramoyl-L-alanine amidase [Planctomycetales bacterium]
PGEKFDWRRLALGGLAVWLDLAWLDPEAANGEGPDAARFQAAARRFGYSVPETGDWCAETLVLWQA